MKDWPGKLVPAPASGTDARPGFRGLAEGAVRPMMENHDVVVGIQQLQVPADPVILGRADDVDPAGLELGTGLPVNPISPEGAVAELLAEPSGVAPDTGPRSWDAFPRG